MVAQNDEFLWSRSVLDKVDYFVVGVLNEEP